MKSNLNKLNATEWLGIGFFWGELCFIISLLISSRAKEIVSALIFSGYAGFIGLLLLSISLMLIAGYFVGHIKSKKI